MMAVLKTVCFTAFKINNFSHTKGYCKRQETVERDILITSRHDNKKLNKLFRIITGPPTCNRKWN